MQACSFKPSQNIILWVIELHISKYSSLCISGGFFQSQSHIKVSLKGNVTFTCNFCWVANPYWYCLESTYLSTIINQKSHKTNTCKIIHNCADQTIFSLAIFISNFYFVSFYQVHEIKYIHDLTNKEVKHCLLFPTTTSY